MFFQQKHSFKHEEITVSRGHNLSFPIHIHDSFELYAQTRGTATVHVDEKEYSLSTGEAVLVFPYQRHCYMNPDNSEFVLCIFSPNLVPDFYQEATRIPAGNLFRYVWKPETALDNYCLRRALAYGICGEFDRDREYIRMQKPRYGEAITSMLIYANENFCGKCLLSDAAVAAGYDYAYSSKLFKRSVGMTFNQYVNLLRIERSRILLQTTRSSVSQIAGECGFSSLRSFHRTFQDALGTTPTYYRENTK